MGRFSDILERSAQKTDAQLASEISSLTRLKDEEINSLFPAQPDKENLLKLLEIVNAATDENNKTAELIKNIDKLAGAAIKLIKLAI
jgi:hypothetical protein